MTAGGRLAAALALGAGLSALLTAAATAEAGSNRAAVAPAEAGSKRAKASAKPAGKTAPRAKASAKTSAKAKDAPKDEAPVPTPGAKLAVFPFTGDDGDAVRRQVLHLLRAKGLKPNTTLRAMFDTPEQYRETAAALGLVAYVDGEVTVDAGEASATIFVRSGANGLRIWSATFSGERRQLASDLGKALWDQWSPALGRACADAAKPRPGAREPMRINAGTPLADSPPDGE
jgi:hypothetical protein